MRSLLLLLMVGCTQAPSPCTQPADLKPAQAALAAGHVDEAVSLLDRHLARCPDAVTALDLRSGVRSRLGQLEPAAADLERAATLDPASPTRRYELALVRSRQGKSGAAIAELQKARVTAPTAPVLLLLGAILGEAGRRDEALVVYQEAVRLFPGLVVARSRLGWLQLERHHLEQAEESLQAGLRLDPACGTCLVGLCAIASRRGNPVDTIESCQRATRAEPLSPEPWYHLGRALQATGRSEEAATVLARHQQAREVASRETAYRKEIARDPAAAWLHRDLGLLYARNGRLEEATLELEAAVAAAPAQADYKSDLARLYASMGQLERGLALANEALAAGETVWRLVNLAHVQALRHDVAALDQALARATALSPDFAAQRPAVEAELRRVAAGRQPR